MSTIHDPSLRSAKGKVNPETVTISGYIVDECYGPGEERSTQFGLNFLRLAKPLEVGNVFTVEPGIYFIPALIDRWRSEGKCADFIDFERTSALGDFGGVRIEDDILCTETGARVLGPGIPKQIDAVEAAMAG